ncbi:hypothetical protein ACW9HR_33590 [Nocardia gipuzkoensis]|uniref:hypothetical protein n=1 Tax=Nocardia TaxID=1817 RepID=UPI0015EEFE11|nr:MULTISPECIES: hypothetical protein [Nocardia]MBF6223020.1 hypothetical protein [Nocardia abscessus]MDE1674531.1 hypothetical protein [Nocardia gipuzkoensis]
MSVRTRTVEAPGRVARRVQDAERVKSGAAQRAYARRRLRAESGSDTAFLPTVRRSAMAARIPFVTAIIALLGCGLALTLLLTTRAAEDSYQLGDARATNRRLADERAALQREVEAADSAPELAARARELGMIPAKDPARLLVGPDGSVTVIGKPAPAQGTPVPPLNASPSARPWGERVVPVTTTPGAPVPGRPSAGSQNPQVNAAPAPGSPVPTPPAAVVPPPSPLPAPPVEAPQPPAETVPGSDAAQPETAAGGVPQ